MTNSNQPEFFDILMGLWFESDLSGSAKSVGQILLMYSKLFGDGALLSSAYCSADTIARLTDLNRSTVYKALNELVESGWFNKIKNFHKSSSYDLNIGVAVEAIARARKMRIFLMTAEGRALWDQVTVSSGAGPDRLKLRVARRIELSHAIELLAHPTDLSKVISFQEDKRCLPGANSFSGINAPCLPGRQKVSPRPSLLERKKEERKERKKGGAPSSALPLQVVNLTGATFSEVTPNGASKDQNGSQDVDATRVAPHPPRVPATYVPATYVPATNETPFERIRRQSIGQLPERDNSPTTFVEFPTTEIRKQGVYGPITRDEDGRLEIADNPRGEGFRKKLMKEFPGLDLRKGLNAAAGSISSKTSPDEYAGKVWQYCGYAFNDMKQDKAKAKYSNGGSSGGNPVFS